MHSPWFRKYIVICLLILLWESTEAESFFAAKKKTEPTVEDALKLIQSQIRFPDIQKEIKANMKYVAPVPSTTTRRILTTTTEDRDLIIEIPKREFLDNDDDSETCEAKKKIFDFRKDRVALFSLSKNIAEAQMYPKSHCNCSRTSMVKKGTRRGKTDRKEKAKIRTLKGKVEKEQTTLDEDDEESVTVVEQLHDIDNEKEAAEDIGLPESAKDREEENKADSQLGDQSEPESSSSSEENGDDSLSQSNKEEEELEQNRQNDKLDKPSMEEVEPEDNTDTQLSQGEEEESTDSQFSDQEKEEETIEFPEDKKEEHLSDSVQQDEEEDVETTSRRSVYDKGAKRTKEPKPTQKRSLTTINNSYSKKPFPHRKKNKEKSRVNSVNLKKTTRATRTKKSINKSNIYMRRNLLLDDDNFKLLKRKYVKKKGNASKGDSLRELLSEIKKLKSADTLSKSVDKKWMDELEDVEDADYGYDYITVEDDERTEFCASPTPPILPPELQQLQQRVESSDVKSLETVARRIYQAARSLRTNIEAKQEGIRKIEEEERLLTTGIGNLQDILRECQTLKAGLDSVRSKSVARLKVLLQTSELQNQVHVKLASKIKEILRVIDAAAINEMLKYT